MYRLTCPDCKTVVRVRMACMGSKARCPNCQLSYRLNDRTMVGEDREELLAQKDRPTPNDNSKAFSSLWTAFTRHGLGKQQPEQLPPLPVRKKASILKRILPG